MVVFQLDLSLVLTQFTSIIKMTCLISTVLIQKYDKEEEDERNGALQVIKALNSKRKLICCMT